MCNDSSSNVNKILSCNVFMYVSDQKRMVISSCRKTNVTVRMCLEKENKSKLMQHTTARRDKFALVGRNSQSVHHWNGTLWLRISFARNQHTENHASHDIHCPSIPQIEFRVAASCFSVSADELNFELFKSVLMLNCRFWRGLKYNGNASTRDSIA